MANEFTDTNITGNLGVNTGDIVIDEAADHASTPGAGKGYIWCKNTSPSTLIFTDDAGTDTTLSSGSGDVSGPGSSVDNEVARFDSTTGKVLQAGTNVTLDDSDNVGGVGNLSLDGDVVFTERADHASTPGAGEGYLWVKNSAPSALYFTDDTGTDTDLTASASGDVSGPGSGTDEALVRMDGTGGKTIQNSGVTLDDSANMAGIANVALTGDIILDERADHASTPGAGKGYIWVKSDTPSSLIFTDDAGTDTDLTASGSGDVTGPGSSTDNEIVRFDSTTGKVIQAGATATIDDSGNFASVGTVNTHTIPGGTGTFALTSNTLGDFGATTSAQLAGTISDETGSGALVFGTSPALTTPNIGTPSAGTLTNCTGLPTAGMVDEAVTNGKLAHMAQQTIKGRAAGAGTGDATDLTLLQALTLLNTPLGVTSTSNSVAWNSDNGQTITHTLTENTTIAATSGTPYDGQKIIFVITQAAGSAYTLAWNAEFVAGDDFSGSIPSVTTVLSGLHYYGWMYSSGKSKWILLAENEHGS